TLMALSGVVAFWACGLLLCLFIGPTQASARTLLLRMTVHGKEGVAFVLYTMTGRAVAPLAPFMFSTFVAVFGADRAGIGGVLLVLSAGFTAMLAFWVPRRAALFSRFAVQIVSPAPVLCCTCTPLTVIEQLTSRPTLMML